MTSEYYSCYTIGFSPDLVQDLLSRDFLLLGIETILYLDNFATTEDVSYLEKNSGAGLTFGNVLP